MPQHAYSIAWSDSCSWTKDPLLTCWYTAFQKNMNPYMHARLTGLFAMIGPVTALAEQNAWAQVFCKIMQVLLLCSKVRGGWNFEWSKPAILVNRPIRSCIVHMQIWGLALESGAISQRHSLLVPIYCGTVCTSSKKLIYPKELHKQIPLLLISRNRVGRYDYLHCIRLILLCVVTRCWR